MRLTVTDPTVVRAEGSIIVLAGADYLGQRRTFACDFRQALDIIDALQSGQDEVQAEPESWSIIT
jgi:hypothetical protein